MDVAQDNIALSLSRALIAANLKARELGIDPEESRILISQQLVDGTPVWRVNYGRKDFGVNRRGGGYILDIDAEKACVLRVQQGQ